MKNIAHSALGLAPASIFVTAHSASAFGLADVTRPLGQNIQKQYIVAKGRAVAPFAHVVFCARQPSECVSDGRSAAVTLDRKAMRDLARVNREVNGRIIAIRENNGLDEWALNPAQGDCDDFAISKRHALIAKGWPSQALRLAVARTSRGEGHLVLVVRTDRGDMVLDNLTNSIRHWKRSGLVWEKIQSAENPMRWNTI